MSATVVIAYATIMDGLVLRWYDDKNAEHEVLSASRNGISVEHGAEIPAGWLADAEMVRSILANARRSWSGDDEARARARQFATHERKFGTREVRRIEPCAS